MRRVVTETRAAALRVVPRSAPHTLRARHRHGAGTVACPRVDRARWRRAIDRARPDPASRRTRVHPHSGSGRARARRADRPAIHVGRPTAELPHAPGLAMQPDRPRERGLPVDTREVAPHRSRARRTGTREAILASAGLRSAAPYLGARDYRLAPTPAMLRTCAPCHELHEASARKPTSSSRRDPSPRAARTRPTAPHPFRRPREKSRVIGFPKAGMRR